MDDEDFHLIGCKLRKYDLCGGFIDKIEFWLHTINDTLMEIECTQIQIVKLMLFLFINHDNIVLIWQTG